MANFEKTDTGFNSKKGDNMLKELKSFNNRSSIPELQLLLLQQKHIYLNCL